MRSWRHSLCLPVDLCCDLAVVLWKLIESRVLIFVVGRNHRTAAMTVEAQACLHERSIRHNNISQCCPNISRPLLPRVGTLSANIAIGMTECG